ncbi:MBL fold metallo-hydrolase [Streptomyces sp. NPDC019990]|uniref:MBL fold metallo-hydrolase n=1 Tax=Streptomyces sp. NPDC019990 TaxID=3154693 RepID=UPI0033EE9D9D
MRPTVLGGCGAWPTAVQACSGYLIEYAGFRLLIDPGYATLPRLLDHHTVDSIDAVLISHGHPDHCADLSPRTHGRPVREPGGRSPAHVHPRVARHRSESRTGNSGAVLPAPHRGRHPRARRRTRACARWTGRADHDDRVPGPGHRHRTGGLLLRAGPG